MFENNKYYLLKLIETSNNKFKSIPDYIKNDIEFILEVNKIYPKCIFYISDKLKNNRNFILKIVKYNGKNYRYIIDIFKNDIEFIIEANKTYPRSLYYVPEYILSEDIILKLLKIDINNFNYIPEIFKNNKNIILNAVKIFPNLLYHEFEIIKNINCDKNFILELIKINYKNYKYIPENYKNDKDIIFNYIKLDSLFLKDKNNLEYDKNILLKILNESESYKNIILELIEINIEIYKYIPDTFKYTQDIILKTIEKDSNFIIKNYGLEYYNIIILKLIKNKNNFEYNKNIIVRLIINDYKYFAYIPDIFKNDQDIILKTIYMYKYNGYNIGIFFRLYFNRLKYNIYFLYELIKYNYYYWGNIPDKFKNDKEFILGAIKYNSRILRYISKELKNNKVFMLEAIKCNKWLIKYISKQLKNDKLFLINCYKSNYKIIEYPNIKMKLKNYKYDNLKKYERLLIDFDKLSRDYYFYFDYNLLKRNEDILHLVDEENIYKIYNLLYNRKYYDIIYNNENIAEYFKIYKNIIFLYINDLDIDNNYNLDELILQYQAILKKKNKDCTIIFF